MILPYAFIISLSKMNQLDAHLHNYRGPEMCALLCERQKSQFASVATNVIFK